MKKLCPLFLSIIMAVVLCACGGKSENVSFAPKTSGSFRMSAEINNGGNQSSAVITRYGNANWDVEFSAPNTLAGVLLSYRDNNVEASYKGLSFSVPKTALPVKAMISNLIEAVDSAADLPEISGEDKDGEMLCNGSNEQGEYTLKFNRDGSLSGFEMPCFELEMTFTDFDENVSPDVEGTENASEAETKPMTADETENTEISTETDAAETETSAADADSEETESVSTQEV